VIVKSRELNAWMPMHMADLVEEGLKEAGVKVEGAKIALLGVAFVENSDDTRNTPSKPLYEILRARGLEPVLHDSYVREFELPFTKVLDEAIKGADALVLVVKHKDYVKLDLAQIKEKMRTPVIVDGRNAYDKAKCEQLGFVYKGVGKPRQTFLWKENFTTET